VDKRTDLHTILLNLINNTNVYFQPPESIKMDYPCIIYSRDKINSDYANNRKYAHSTRYQITAIDRNPDSLWQLDILDLPLCQHVRHFVHDGLHHDVYEIYF
jgi:hypothetical protein